MSKKNHGDKKETDAPGVQSGEPKERRLLPGDDPAKYAFADMPPKQEAKPPPVPPKLPAQAPKSQKAAPKVVKAEPVRVVPRIKLAVFCQLSGVRWDRMAAFKHYAKKQKLEPLSVPEWWEAYKAFHKRPVG